MSSITFAPRAASGGAAGGAFFNLIAEKSYDCAQSFFAKMIPLIEANEVPSILCHKFNLFMHELKITEESLLELFTYALVHSQTQDPESAFLFRKNLDQIEETFELHFGTRLARIDSKPVARLLLLDPSGKETTVDLTFQLGYTSDLVEALLKWNCKPARGGAGDGPITSSDEPPVIDMREIFSLEQFNHYLALKTAPPDTPIEPFIVFSSLPVAGFLGDKSVLEKISTIYLEVIEAVSATNKWVVFNDAFNLSSIDDSDLDSSFPELFAEQKIIRGILEFLKELYPHLKKGGVTQIIERYLQILVERSLTKTISYDYMAEVNGFTPIGPGIEFLISELLRIKLETEEDPTPAPITDEELHRIVKKVLEGSGDAADKMVIETSALTHEESLPTFLKLHGADSSYSGICTDYGTTFKFDGEKTGAHLTDEELKRLAQVFYQIKELSISNSVLFTGSSLSELPSSMKKLRIFRSFSFDPIHFSCMEHLKELESFVLIGLSHLADEHLVFLQYLSSLRELILESCPSLTGSGFGYLAPLTKLKRLVLSGSNFEDTNLKFLKPFTQLLELDLSCCRSLRGSTFYELHSFPIEHLNLTRTYIRDAEFSDLSAHPTLRKVSIASCPLLTDESIRVLNSIPHLSYVTLSNSPAEEYTETAEFKGISLKAIGALLEKPSMEVLHLHNYEGEKDFPEFLEKCKKFPKVNVLSN